MGFDTVFRNVRVGSRVLLKARGFTKLYTGIVAPRTASEIRSAASTRPPGVSMLR